MMTNEEKASYIARELVNMGVRGKFDIANKASIMMAEWKDKQCEWHKVSNDEFPEITSEETYESLMYIGDNNHDTLTCKTNVMLSDELLLSREDGTVKIGRFRKIETFSIKDNALITSWVGFLYENGYECKLNDNEIKAWMELPKYEEK